MPEHDHRDAKAYSSTTVEATLDQETVHRDWATVHAESAGLRLDETIRRRALEIMKLPPNARMLDAGCGPQLRHSIEFVPMGFRIDAIDIATPVVESARRVAEELAAENPITVWKDSLVELSAASNTYDFILCAHVLMHVPEIQRAIEQLIRALKPGGWLLVMENNAYSFQEFVRNRLKILYSDPRLEPEGNVYITHTSNGEEYIMRQLNVGWFLDFCARHGARLEKRWAREFTELYAVFRNPLLAGLVRKLNTALFWVPGIAPLAFQNVLLLRKESSISALPAR
jgi:2-polyprenyl-3-methyl-5-hydroxy-6-metoxy-1,4-benzoquinol methylase